jgi:hypothetical protein
MVSSATLASPPGHQAGNNSLEREDARAARFCDVALDLLSRRSPGELLEIARDVAGTVEALSEKLKPLLAAAVEAVERLEAAPKVTGYERFLQDELKYPVLMPRFWSYALLHWGEVRQAENFDGRRVGGLVRQIASIPEESALAISRRALKLKSLCVAGHGGAAIDEAISDAKSEIGRFEFDAMVEGASTRDRAACLALRCVCKKIADFVPDPRGRPITRALTTHEMLQRHMVNNHRPAGHTFNPHKTDGGADGGCGDYVDPKTLATRAAFAQPRFCPKRAKGSRPSPPSKRIGHGRSSQRGVSPKR